MQRGGLQDHHQQKPEALAIKDVTLDLFAWPFNAYWVILHARYYIHFSPESQSIKVGIRKLTLRHVELDYRHVVGILVISSKVTLFIKDLNGIHG